MRLSAYLGLHIFIDGRYNSLKVLLLFFIHSKPELNESLGLSKGRYIILLSLSKTRGKNGTWKNNAKPTVTIILPFI